jgi:hypothetical protein
MAARRTHLAWRLVGNFILLVAIVCALGCSDDSSGRLISGTVTFDGRPLDNGQIVFEPQGAGKMGVAQINAGAYALPTGFGLQDGEYRVRITSDRPTGQTIAPAAYSEDREPLPIQEQFLPSKYNLKSELSISVSNETGTQHDFSLTSN